jgi:large subunit ribosomal protein L13
VNTLSYKTISANAANANKEWLVVDAQGQRLGRLCSKVAKIVRGKYKPNFTPHADCGDNVIIINADKIELTGNKWEERIYLRYTGFPGGQREMTPRQLQRKSSERLFKKVLKGMLPKNKLGAKLLGHVYIFDGAEHNMQAQQPRTVDINQYK